MSITHGFELIREEKVAEINSLAHVYKHVKTGAEFISVLNDDENKSFGIAFATPWNDSTGIAHIMEHSVLCGSRKYPLKEPFIELAKGSLNTFLNAMTYPDKTVYPVASQNTQDYQTVLTANELGPIRKRVAGEFDHDHGILPSLINLAILQFQSSNSVEQAATIMNQQLELISHRVDMRYGLVRFIAWIVPTLGFIGTVFSLGASLYAAGDPNKAFDPKDVAMTLGVGFDCTMVALMESAILVFILHLVQEQEETALNRAGDYTLRNLINRLYSQK